MNVQKNFFTWNELTSTNTGLLNNPTSPVHLVNLANLWNYLNFLRERLGAPIYVNSAFRTPAVNKQVGGSKCSYHMEGLAADICTISTKMLELRDLLFVHYQAKESILSEFIDHETYYHIAI